MDAKIDKFACKPDSCSLEMDEMTGSDDENLSESAEFSAPVPPAKGGKLALGIEGATFLMGQAVVITLASDCDSQPVA